jgi:hypothetical protein
MTLFYIECVLLDATFTMPLEFAPVVKGYSKQINVYVRSTRSLPNKDRK